jgi:hypothetical protein
MTDLLRPRRRCRRSMALVWQDDQDRVWLTYNTSEYNAKYVLPRHGLAASDDASKILESFLNKLTDQSTQ